MDTKSKVSLRKHCSGRGDSNSRPSALKAGLRMMNWLKRSAHFPNGRLSCRNRQNPRSVSFGSVPGRDFPRIRGRVGYPSTSRGIRTEALAPTCHLRAPAPSACACRRPPAMHRTHMHCGRFQVRTSGGYAHGGSDGRAPGEPADHDPAHPSRAAARHRRRRHVSCAKIRTGGLPRIGTKSPAARLQPVNSLIASWHLSPLNGIRLQ